MSQFNNFRLDSFQNSSTYLKGFEIDYIDDETETDDGRMSSEKETTEPDDEYYDPSYLYCSDEDIEQLCKALCESEMGKQAYNNFLESLTSRMELCVVKNYHYSYISTILCVYNILSSIFYGR